MSNVAPVVVIGSGLAGYNTVKEFRKLDKETPVLVLSLDDGHSYSKPMLSTGLTKGKQADDLSMGDPGKMAEQLNASIRNYTTVDAIDTESKLIKIGEESIAYSKLVLATGAVVNKLNFPGSDLDKVVSINDLMDYRTFREKLEGKKHVLIMGAGLIGCEYANDLLNGEYQVTVVNPANTTLTGLVPEFAGKALERALSDAGVAMKMDCYATSIEDNDSHLVVTLSNNEKVECDLVISAVGLKANITLAAASNIDSNKGIKTNNLLETSAKDVYAIGDCAEIEGIVRLYVLPLMTSARALAKTLTGTPTPVSFGPMPVATKTPVCPVVVCPPNSPEGEWQFETSDDSENDICGRFVSTDDKVTGFVLTGSRCNEKQALVKELS